MAQARSPASPRSPPSPGSAAGRSRPSAGRCRSSVMWRRSSRRCAVMPSAPASAARMAARTGSGWSPPRAFRMVATWSMLTPRRRRPRHAAARLPGLIGRDRRELRRKGVGLVGRDVDADQRGVGHAEIGVAARAVDDRRRGDDLAARFLDRLDRFARRQAGGHDVLDHQHFRAAARGGSRGGARTCPRAARRRSRACPSARPISWPMITPPIAGETTMSICPPRLVRELAASARAIRSARAGSISTRAHCR